MIAWILISGSLLGIVQPDVPAIAYTVRFPEPHTHYVEVEATYPSQPGDETQLMMAVWTPGSYLVREFARHVEGISAWSPDGSSLPIRKTRKNRWTVATGGVPKFILRYRVYCREMSVRTNWVQADYAMLNGAPTFITLADDGTRPHDVTLELPATWQRSVTGLAKHADGGAHHYRAPDFDTLVDCPIVCGNPTVHEFEVGGKPHFLVNQGEGGVWDGPRSAGDVKKIVEAHFRLWRVMPYQRYFFLNMITESGGGLEHKNSTLMMTSRWRTGVAKDYRGWLGLVSHEFFHTWNVKRLRPVELGPFDYEKEVHTTGLWIAEGITSYYDDLQVHRAGLMNRKQYLEALSRQIESLQTTPGRLVQPLGLSSYDAWIKHYRRDENSSNTSISYYTKGAVVAFLLDAEIRRLTEGEKSLDDVLRRAYEIYSGERGFTSEEFRYTAREIAGHDLSDWFRRTVDTTEELDYRQALDYFGLRFKPPKENKKDEKKDGEAALAEESDGESEEDGDAREKDEPPRGWIGLRTRDSDGRLVVSQVRRETPAHRFGFNVDDEVLAIDDYRVRPGGWKSRLQHYGPGDEATVLIARRDQLIRIPVTFETEPPKKWKLQIRKDATDEQKARLDAWLGAKAS